jgi:type IV pilus assembly protein PilA
MKGADRLARLHGSQAGYNMIEMLTVIVIIALLAALIIPGMVSMIDEAKKQANVTTAHAIYIAAQAKATEIAGTATAEKPYHIPTAEDLKTYVADDGLYEGITSLTVIDDNKDGTIDGIIFVKDGDTVELVPGGKVTINGQDSPVATPSSKLEQN